MDSVEDIFTGLTDEQKRRASELRTPEEMLAFAQEEGYDLTDDQLETVAGGWTILDCSGYKICPNHHCGQVGS